MTLSFVGVRRLLYQDVAPGSAYHAALIAVEGQRARGFQVTEHSHDFYELMYVLAGEALHSVNGSDAPLLPGGLVFLRPGDRHSVRFQSGRLLHYINIALDAHVWDGFRDMTGIGPAVDSTRAGRGPIVTALSEAQAVDCAAVFRRALEWYEHSSEKLARSALSHLEACRLLSAVVSWLIADGKGEDTEGDALPEGTPLWLVRACRALKGDSDKLREGLPAFVAAAGVTPTHLARALKAAIHHTPTEYINRLRLDRAARLLTTTTLPVLDIAGECGFEQASYFYRRFRDHFATTPQAYRNAAAQRVAPEPRRRSATEAPIHGEAESARASRPSAGETPRRNG